MSCISRILSWSARHSRSSRPRRRAIAGALVIGLAGLSVGADARADGVLYQIQMYVPVSSLTADLGSCFVAKDTALLLDNNCKFNAATLGPGATGNTIKFVTRYGVLSATQVPVYKKTSVYTDTLSQYSVATWDYVRDDRWEVCDRYSSGMEHFIATSVYRGSGKRSRVEKVEYKEGGVYVDSKYKGPEEILRGGPVGLLLTPLKDVCSGAARHKVQSLEASLKAAQERIRQLEVASEKAGKDLEEAGSRVENLRRKLSDADKEKDESARELSKAKEEIKTERSTAETLREALKACSPSAQTTASQ
jgi:hypothetical protein